MLQSIRDRTQGWLTWFLVITICITFALWGIHSYFQTGSSSQSVATVNGEVITQSQLQSAYEQLRAQQAQVNNNPQYLADNESLLKRQALEQLIRTTVLSQAALKSGYRVDQAQLAAIIMQIPVFSVNGHFSSEQFNEVIARLGYQPDSFLHTLQAQVLQNQVQLGHIFSAFALPNEVQQIQTLLNQRRDIAYVKIPTEQFADKIKITEEQLNNYYKQNLNTEFMQPDQVSISFIELSLNRIAAQQAVSEQEIKQYYQDNAETMSVPARYHLAHILIKLPNNVSAEQTTEVQAKLQKLTTELAAKSDFQALAKSYSDDIMSAKQGGDLGWVHLNELEPAVSKAVSKLTQPGMVTQPIHTPFGYEIVKLLAIEPAKPVAFEQVKENIALRLKQQKAQQVFTDLNDKLANLTFSDPNSLDTTAKQLGLTVQQTPFFTRNGGDIALTRNSKVIAAAFNKDVLDGNNSDLIEVTPGEIIVLRVNQFKPASPIPFDKVKDKMLAKLRKAEMLKLAKQLSENIVAEIRSGKTLDEIASTYHLKWSNVTGIARHSETLDPNIVKTAFSMPLAADKSRYNSQLTQLPAGDYVVVVLKSVINSLPNKVSPQANEAFARELAISYGQVAYQLYVDYLLKKAKIKNIENTAP